jgi:hypothetical protein
MRGILRSLPSQPTINSSARLGNRFIPRPDELVSYGGGVFDADRPCPLMTAKSGADGVLNAPVFHGKPVSRLWETTGQCGQVLAIFSAALQPGQEQISKGHIPRAAAIFGASICCKNNDGNCLISRKYIQR